MTKFADLHIHTHFSDGIFSPQEVVAQAKQNGLQCIGITDHDTIKGIAPALDAACDGDIEVIPAIEMSCELEGRDIHLLGYFIDVQNSDLKQILSKMQSVRKERLKKMVQKLNDLGIKDIDPDSIIESVQTQAVGRPHLARALVEKGVVSSTKEAFDRFLAEGQPAYEKKWKILPKDAIRLIRQAKGVSVLAHPMVSNIDRFISSLVDDGLGGVEVFYPNYSEATVQYYLAIAKEYSLAVTGGSDAHGHAKENTFIGKIKLPYHYIEELKAKSA